MTYPSSTIARRLCAGVVVLVALCAAPVASAAQPSNVTVCIGGSCDAPSVQAGVDLVAPGGTVTVKPGTYVETVDISKPLTLHGSGPRTVILSPTMVTARCGASGTTRQPIICVNNTVDGGSVNIDSLVVDGNGQGAANTNLFGIFYLDTPGSISRVGVDRVRSEPISGVQGGVAINFDNTGTPVPVSVDHSTVTDYQKAGIVFNGDLTATATANTVTGAGLQPIGANGVQVAFGALATVTGNTITDNRCDATLQANCGTDAVNKSQSGGVILLGAKAGTVIKQNTITGNDTGVDVESESSTPGPQSVTVSDNVLTGNRDFGVDVFAGQATIKNNRITGAPTAVGILALEGTAAAAGQITAEGNELRGLGTALRVFDNTTSDTNNVPSLTAGYNRISGNTVGFANTIAAQQKAENNYWGCNAGPNKPGCDTTTGSVDSDPFLVLKLTSSASKLNAGQTATLTASLRQNSDGTSLGPIPFPASDVTFTTDKGTVDSPRATVDGQATSQLRSSKTGGVTNVSAKLDNQTVTTVVNVAVPAGPFVSIVSSSVKVGSHGQTPVRVKCAQTTATCRGTLRLTARIGRHTVTIGSRTFAIKKNSTATVNVRISSKARAAARSKKGLRARATATGRDVRGVKRTTSRIVRLHR